MANRSDNPLKRVIREKRARGGRRGASHSGFYYRSDHFSFAKVGIPAFYADPGVEYIGKPEGYGIEKREQYTAEDYHAPSDEVKDDWDLSGAVEDLSFFYRMGHRLATSTAWPAWSETSEFRAIREAQMGAQ